MIKDKGLRKRSLYFILVMIIDTLMIILLKEGVGRERPDPESRSKRSFPSGHAARSIFTAKIVGDWYPRFRIFFYLFVILSSLTRIYFGVHFVSDVFAGLVISYTTATIYLYVFEKYLDKKEGEPDTSVA